MIYIVNGPNLNLLGTREPNIYGTKTLAEISSELEKIASTKNVELKFYQSNSEGSLIDYMQSLPKSSKVIFNPGALAHTSISLRDCISAMEHKVVEVHLSNIFSREEFRHHSFISPVACGVISGLGSKVYELALKWFIESEQN